MEAEGMKIGDEYTCRRRETRRAVYIAAVRYADRQRPRLNPRSACKITVGKILGF